MAGRLKLDGVKVTGNEKLRIKKKELIEETKEMFAKLDAVGKWPNSELR